MANIRYRRRGTSGLWSYEADGTVTLKEAAEIGAVKQADGTVALKDDKGDLKVLPSTGEVSSVFGIIGGFLLSVLGLAGYSYAKKHEEK